MATMIPEKPHSFDPASQEGIMFDALAKLPLKIIYHALPVAASAADIVQYPTYFG